VGLDRGLGIEIEHWTQQLLQLRSGNLRHILVKVEIHKRAVGVGGRIRRRNRHRRSRAYNRNALIPLLLLEGTAVDLKADMVVFDDHIADAAAVAEFRGWSPERQQVLQFRPAGGYGAISEFQSSLSHREGRADVDQLFIKGVDNFFAGLLRNPWGRSIAGQRD